MMEELIKKKQIDPGSQGRPEWYPKPPQDKDLLFFIQRNQNQDAIVYRVNRSPEGLIHRDIPMDAFWMRFTDGGVRSELNEYQSRLAYGYESCEIDKGLYRFKFVSYADLHFFIRQKSELLDYEVVFKEADRYIILDCIYVYAVEFGVFPDVKFFELFGRESASGKEFYKKVNIEV